MIAELDGAPAGFALFHGTFSTWECRPGIWLEDLFVLPRVPRLRGRRARCSPTSRGSRSSAGYARLDWTALDWNEPALGFYERLGARRARRVADCTV